ncbi:MAG: hypothetical protein PHU36_03910 [Syntrophomonadaceae bacterium]|nr:hypothetical protein [Syntrophomonadaceae bacterium]
MNKKLAGAVIVLIIAAVLLFLFINNRPGTGSDVEYKNEKYGFALTMDEEFDQNVEIQEAENTVYFVSREIQATQPDMIFGVIGRIEIYDKSEFTKATMLESGEAYGLKYLGENDTYLFGWAHATDVQVPPGDEKLLNNFRSLENDFDEIIKSFTAMKALPPETSEVKTDTGRYVGLADNNFFEVKISGVPDEKAYKVFMITDQIRSKFESLDLQGDEEIKLKYKENEYGQNAVEDIEKINQ